MGNQRRHKRRRNQDTAHRRDTTNDNDVANGSPDGRRWGGFTLALIRGQEREGGGCYLTGLDMASAASPSALLLLIVQETKDVSLPVPHSVQHKQTHTHMHMHTHRNQGTNTPYQDRSADTKIKKKDKYILVHQSSFHLRIDNFHSLKHNRLSFF